MAAVETLEIFGQIQVLVIDKLQVVSYKWLSRNFSVSSNHAKRFSCISNTFIRRTVGAKLAGTSSTSLHKDNTGANLQGKVNSYPKDEFCQPQHGKPRHLDANEGQKFPDLVRSVEKTAQNVKFCIKKPQPVKESSSSLQIKRGIQNDKTSHGNGRSLATLWGRASEKSKPSSLAGHAPDTADGQIRMQEAANASSSDEDGYGIPRKRDSNGTGTRKRQFIVDFSDEDDEVDEEEKVVSLSSPEPPNAKSLHDSLQGTSSLNMEKEIFKIEEQKVDAPMTKKEIEEKSHGSTHEKDINADFPLPKAENSNHNEIFNIDRKDNTTSCASALAKRKKLLKTRIDERGREVPSAAVCLNFVLPSGTFLKSPLPACVTSVVLTYLDVAFNPLTAVNLSAMLTASEFSDLLLLFCHWPSEGWAIRSHLDLHATISHSGSPLLVNGGQTTKGVRGFLQAT
ncbi:hypothetical protein AXF42_Ash015744 [Apostasia shenzhenica]|uniref:DNA polymerase delta subunit 3 n=1 Tax=Apostasia shenzhenica TaxID=1088818 RepID=A0A2H9ZU93_9ASPA|nr:hypothetical protein AXF42_Ash015744 [Apostasia shenzhenica]